LQEVCLFDLSTKHVSSTVVGGKRANALGIRRGAPFSPRTYSGSRHPAFHFKPSATKDPSPCIHLQRCKEPLAIRSDPSSLGLVDLSAQMLDRERHVALDHFRIFPAAERHQRRSSAAIHDEPRCPVMAPIVDPEPVQGGRFPWRMRLVTCPAGERVVRELLQAVFRPGHDQLNPRAIWRSGPLDAIAFAMPRGLTADHRLDCFSPAAASILSADRPSTLFSPANGPTISANRVRPFSADHPGDAFLPTAASILSANRLR
jgi:hypothetical protein